MPDQDIAQGDGAKLSPRAIALGLHRSDTYYDFDTCMREPCIPGTAENWENGTLGTDERYVRVAASNPELDAVVKKMKASRAARA